MSNTISGILCRALRLIRYEQPQAYQAIAARLEGMTVRFDFDDTLYLRVEDDEILQSGDAVSSDVLVRGERPIVRRLVTGKITLTQAVYAGELEIAGAIGPLSCALSAADFFIASLLRIEDTQELLTALEA